MLLRTFNVRRWLPILVACASIGTAAAQLATAAKPGSGLLHRSEGGKASAEAPKATEAPESKTATTGRPAYQVADRSEAAMAAAVAPQLAPGQSGEHPLMPVLRWAYSGIGNIAKIQDYSATLAKRERINGKVGEYEYTFIKVRQNPLSVYMCFLGPAELKGQECIYVEGQNDGNMLAHGVGIKNSVFGTVKLKPDGPIAMRGQRYPITELGILNLTRRLVEVGEQDVKYGECNVKFYEGAKINNRVCTCIEVVHPTPRRNFLYHLARIFVDKEYNLPIRYESYDWPKEKSGKPELIEEYTYLNLKLDNSFTDADFDVKNPSYKFR